MNHFNDFSSIYIDGSIGGIYNFVANASSYHPFNKINLFAHNRWEYGYITGKTQASRIIQQLMRDANGNIIETIKVITHSMGSVFSKGYLQAIVDYINANPELCNDLSITEYNFAPFQPQSYNAILGVDTYQYSHEYDRIAGDQDIKGAKQQTTSKDKEDGHSIADFLKYINTLPQGVYKFIDGKLVQ